MSQILSCADSPLSITGNVIGILTFAYAVLITLVYRTKQLASANEEMELFLQRASSELEAFLAARERLIKHLPVFPRKFGSEIEPLLAGTQDTVVRFEDQFKTLKELGGRKPSIFEGSRFVWTREDFIITLGEMSRIRSNLNGIYQVLVNSAIFEEIQKQNAALEKYHKSACKQNHMLRQIMDALDLETPKTPEESEEDSAISPPSGTFDMLEMYLHSMKQEPDAPRPHGRASPPWPQDSSYSVVGPPGNRRLVWKGPVSPIPPSVELPRLHRAPGTI